MVSILPLILFSKHLEAIPGNQQQSIIIIILLIWVLADSFPQESEWQQVSSSLQDSS